jgi:DNA-binding CsgD family transcriptional regulator
VVVLADARGRILSCRGPDRIGHSRSDRLGVAPGFVWHEEQLGTSAVGTPLAHGKAILVTGDDHFADILTGVSGSGTPVIDPRTGRPVGVVAILRRRPDASHLMSTVVRQAARDVERRLRDAASERQQALHDVFVRALRHASGPLALVAPEALLTDGAAARLLGPSGGGALWSIVHEAARREDRVSVVVPVGDGACVVGRCEAVRDGTEVVAALVHLTPEPTSPHLAPHRGRRSRSGRPRFGWESLSETELMVADLAARGRTNREIADELIMSPHTVDSHVRHIYAKLGISSRIDLTRAVLANARTAEN